MEQNPNTNEANQDERTAKKKKRNKIIKIVIGIIILLKVVPYIIIAIADFFALMSASSGARPHIYHLFFILVVTIVLLVALAKWQQQVVLLENPIERMKKYDKTQFFVAEIAKAESYYNSLQLHKKQNKNKKITNETVRAAYQEIYQKMENRFEAICQYIEHFDYIAYRSADQATTVAIEEELAALADLIDKLNRLDTINIKIENMALDNDTDRIKFLIESLEELNAKDE